MKRPISEIQEEIQNSHQQLKLVIGKLKLPELLENIRSQYPSDTDTEAVKDGLVCPPLAWEIHNEVANASIMLEEAMASLRKASRQTEESVRKVWYRRRLEEIKDPPTRALVRHLISIVE